MNKQVWGAIAFCMGLICGIFSGVSLTDGHAEAGLFWCLGSLCAFLVLSLAYQNIAKAEGK
jgi:hypothetical protein